MRWALGGMMGRSTGTCITTLFLAIECIFSTNKPISSICSRTSNATTESYCLFSGKSSAMPFCPINHWYELVSTSRDSLDHSWLESYSLLSIKWKFAKMEKSCSTIQFERFVSFPFSKMEKNDGNFLKVALRSKSSDYKKKRPRAGRRPCHDVARISVCWGSVEILMDVSCGYKILYRQDEGIKCDYVLRVHASRTLWGCFGWRTGLRPRTWTLSHWWRPTRRL